MTTIDGNSPDQPSSREVALHRNAAAAALLRRAARLAHVESVPQSSLPSILRPQGTYAEGGGWFAVGVRISFVVLFVIPTVLAIIYYALIATGQYETEFRFAVKEGDQSSLEQVDAASALGAATSISQSQDTLVVTNYIKSQGLVEALDKEINLRAMFSRDNVDFISAFNPRRPIEDLVNYWGHRAKVSIEAQSGLVTVDISAFTPEDALAIARAVVRHSEQLANDVSQRSANDLLRDTQAELGRAETRLKETRAALQDLRNTEGRLDAANTANSLDDVLSALRLDRSQAASQLAAASEGLSPSAPQLKALRARVAALDEQIAKIEADMTGGSKSGNDDLSAAMTRFDTLQLDNEVAEKRYAAAVSALQAARLAAERQRVYINSFVEPNLPQSATAPSRFYNSLAVAFGSFVVWALLVGFAGVIRKQMV